MAPALMVTAPAKVNLFLEITGRRADGYHLLDSLFVFTAHGDTLTFAPADDLALTIDGPFAGALDGAADDNLVLRAARLLAAETGVAAKAAIRLTKNLPVAAGIGGGSADAAAALRGLNDLWGAGLDDAALARLGIQLGADVPACLAGRPILVEGVGEGFMPVVYEGPKGILLANPGLPLETPPVFRAYREASKAFDAGLPPAAAYDLEAVKARRNSLAGPAINVLPAIADVLKTLETLHGVRLARMSGSGATCFALFDSEAEAGAAARSLIARHPDWWLMADRIGA
ncbi:4-(cytidine 5'-diphospho)-2-C-methyl-D-erythritol kinase [Gimibacter soli]|uniref:4-diphosphocytidyl-2-C-methyl-D-erythritol kinase n=1 Tax=Gimibacter soli TaxID=3024400 RepID=A0AAE9XUF0_9PROT|nr:4-(cytidine 5'-diphospho)-2-C-methyl-D-erythritol kinase [Gimibacter soli]WCL53748.1 4-(cytidine 5'-diphospho)-2-C-methyl-D-erythritol kinase [Gimibacter soli]